MEAAIKEITETPTTTAERLRDLLHWVQPEHRRILNVDENSNLKLVGLAADALKDKLTRLRKDVEQRRDNFEINLQQLRRRRDIEAERLRGEYDSCIDRGDSVGADEAMEKLAACRKDLVSAARNVADCEADLSDLDERQRELGKDAAEFLQRMDSVVVVAQALRQVAGGLLSLSGEGIASDIRKIESTITKLKKDAEGILAE